ncbi:unnamed protein product [Rangifer tarandus platyrhynchus]|uniref:Uncharacterized protein n=3 Tax=Rangifer tarandus platyrhynchus TaxID=3082113 RepID=A0AC59ZY51_RANTA|nr:unnamed protein product [Rangifer tarandus platyrhynchus]CAI9709402.1 unnamed protein product [Rangifer tarandus platyrhynchus]
MQGLELECVQELGEPAETRSLPTARSRQAQIPAPKLEFNEQLPCTAVWSPYPPDPVLAGVACSHKLLGPQPGFTHGASRLRKQLCLFISSSSKTGKN